MQDFRTLKANARRALHERMKVRALYIPDPEDLSTFQHVEVRLHTKAKALGSLSGTAYDADVESIIPKILFFRDQVAVPLRGAIVSVAEDEAYRVDVNEPPDGLSITASVIPLPIEDTVGLPLPED